MSRDELVFGRECLSFRQQASSDDYLLEMTHNQIDEILISLGWEKLLRKDHLMLFRKYDNDLEVYSYKSKKIYHYSFQRISSLVFGTFNDISALVFLQVQVSEFMG